MGLLFLGADRIVLGSDTVSLGGPDAQAILPTLVTGDDGFFAATVAPGAVALSPPLVAGDDGFFAATVAPGAVALSPPLVTGDDEVFTPTVSVGAVSLAPPLVTGDDEFFGAVVAVPVYAFPPLVIGDDEFFGATVLRSAKGALLLSGWATSGSLLSISNNGAIFGVQAPGAVLELTGTGGQVVGKLPAGNVLEIS